MTRTRRTAFTLVELLVVIVIMAVLAIILIPAIFQHEPARRFSCLSNEKMINLAAHMYMEDYDGAFYHRDEGYVLDDGSQAAKLPPTVAGCVAGGKRSQNVETPWVIAFQPYINDRHATFCPDDTAPRSQHQVKNIVDYNGGITVPGHECSAAPNGEQCLAEKNGWEMWSYMLNSIFTHKSCRYVLEGVLPGFATESVVDGLDNPNIIMFSERNSVALDAANNTDYEYIPQDDYDTWPGEAPLVRWGGSTPYANEGWIKYDRHNGGANYVYYDGHCKWLRWGQARIDQYPDHIVRFPLTNPPQ